VNVLVANAGSSSVKLRVLGSGDEVLASTNLDPGGDLAAGVRAFLGGAGELGAAGHRVVHGGHEFRDSVIVDASVEQGLRGLLELAPLHNRPALDLLDAVSAATGVPQVACFDTAFHAAMPEAAARYAVPAAWRRDLGVRRFGFHGLSHGWATERAGALLGRPAADLRLVTCHLGAGASLAAVAAGRSVDTTMGFTPNDGLVMATRSGSLDPGMLMWVQRRLGLDAAAMDHALEHESGLLGLAGSADVRELEERAGSDPEAATALAVYVHRIRASIAAMAAATGGADAVVFTGGVGENSAVVREKVCAGLGFLGVGLDRAANDAAGGEDADLTEEGAATAVLLVHSREDIAIAREVRRVVGA
jgi:acetate kinase